MSSVILACVLAACLIPQARVGAVSEPSAENHPTHSPTTSPPDICQLPPYNIKNLTRENYWFAIKEEDLESPEITCFDPLATSCTFYFAFCQPIQGVKNKACQGAAVCQVDKYPNGTLTGYSMGQFSNTTQQFYETNGTVAGSFYVDVVNGTRNSWDAACAKSTTGISTRIVLECNSTVQWTSQNLTDIIKVNYSEPCSYTLTLPYAGACRPATPTTTSPSIAPASTTNTSAPTSHPVKPTSHSVKPAPTSSSATVSTSTTHAHRSSSVSPNPKPTVSPNPNPPTTTNPENTTTTNPENITTTNPENTTTTHHPTTPEHPTTPHPHKPTTHANHPTNKTTTLPPEPVKNDSHVIHGLIAGVVIFALISVVLLVLLIFAGRVLYTKAGPYRRVSNNDDM